MSFDSSYIEKYAAWAGTLPIATTAAPFQSPNKPTSYHKWLTVVVNPLPHFFTYIWV